MYLSGSELKENLSAYGFESFRRKGSLSGRARILGFIFLNLKIRIMF